MFQLQDKSKDPTQFNRTIEAIERYSNKTFDLDLSVLFDKMQLPEVEKPVKPSGDEIDNVDFDIYREKVKLYAKEEKSMVKTMRALYAIVWGQCSQNVVTKLNQCKDEKIWRTNGDCAKLLQTIKEIVLKYGQQKNEYLTLFRQVRYFMTYRQREQQDLHRYFEVFQLMTDTIDHLGGSFVHPGYVTKLKDDDEVSDADRESMNDEDNQDYNDRAKDRFLALAFLSGARNDQYSDLLVDLENDSLKGYDNFPCTVVEAYHMLANYATKRKNYVPHQKRQVKSNAVGFLQNGVEPNGSPVPGIDGVTHGHIKCYACKKHGHYSNKCPHSMLQHFAPASPDDDVSGWSGSDKKNDVDEECGSLGFGFAQYCMTQNERYSGLNRAWVLLDTQSNVDIFCNKRLLKNVRRGTGPGLHLRSNGGTMVTRMVGDIPGYGTVWFNPSSLANILSFANIRKRFNVHLNTGPNDPNPSIVVVKPNGKKLVFSEHSMGLYVYDSDDHALRIKNTHKLLKPSYDYMFLNTVALLSSEFTKREVNKAKRAHSLYCRLGRPSLKKFLHLLTNNGIRDCPVLPAHAKRALYLFGPDVATLKGKTTRATPNHVPDHDVIPVPAHIKQWHNDVTLCIDIFFVNGLAFFHSISRNIKFRTVEEIPSRAYKHLLLSVQNILNVYQARDFNVHIIRGDLEFDCLRDALLPIQFQPSAKGEHVPEIERSIRTLKEHFRSSVHGLPYQFYTKLMVRSLVMNVCRLLNSFPSDSGVSDSTSPLSIVCGMPPPCFHDFDLAFGMYAQVHDNNAITNTSTSRTTGAIALRPYNDHGSWAFMSLVMGDQIIRSKWTQLPIPSDVIEQVHDLALTQKQSKLDVDATFTWLSGDRIFPIGPEGANTTTLSVEESIEANNELEANDEEVNNELNDGEAHANVNVNDVTDDEQENENDDLNGENIHNNEFVNDVNDDDENNDFNISENVNDQRSENLSEPPNASQMSENENSELEAENEANEAETNEDERSEELVSIFGSNMKYADNVEERSGEETSDEHDDHEEKRSETSGDAFNPEMIEAQSGVIGDQHDGNEGETKEQLRYNLRKKIKHAREQVFNKKHYNFLSIYSNKTMRYSKRVRTHQDYHQGVCNALVRIQNNEPYDSSALQRDLIGCCMTQMSEKKGIRMFGEKALEAMAKEYAQLDQLTLFTPRDARELDYQQRRDSLNIIDLIKEKRCGKIKGRTVVDGRGQRDMYDKSDTSSPALTTESFIATLVIDAAEGRDVSVCDVAGAFLKADQPDFVLLRVTGPAIDAVVKANKEKYEKFITFEGKTRVLYLQLLKAMYGTLTAALLWYQMFAEFLLEQGFELNKYDMCVANKIVNDSQLTICWYVDDLKISHKDEKEVTKMIEVIENKFGKMNVSRGSQHTYLGMDFVIKDRKVEIMMKSYLQECIDAYGEAINTNAATPANKDLFVFNEKSQPLDERRAKIYVHIVQKLLHVCKRSRLDLQVGIGYMCTRVKDPRQQDWMKLRRMLQYIRGTMDLKRVVSLESSLKMDIFIDASHATHHDMKGQTGGCIMMGDGVIHGRSNKQKLNTKSSTETELVGNSDYLPFALWLLYFYECQGYKIHSKKLHQDNQSTIKMLKNGRASCGSQSRHINIRYFWVVDRIKQKDNAITVEYCPTGRMVADFFTKPLQGSLFRRMRDVVHGLSPRSILNVDSNGNLEKMQGNNGDDANKEQRVRFADNIESNDALPNTKRKERVGKYEIEDEIVSKNRNGCAVEFGKAYNEERTYASVLKRGTRMRKHT